MRLIGFRSLAQHIANLKEMKISIRGILFDMDGVLISSIGSVERSWTKWAESRGIDPARAIRMPMAAARLEPFASCAPI